jgi:hypothetical protein
MPRRRGQPRSDYAGMEAELRAQWEATHPRPEAPEPEAPEAARRLDLDEARRRLNG